MHILAQNLHNYFSSPAIPVYQNCQGGDYKMCNPKMKRETAPRSFDFEAQPGGERQQGTGEPAATSGIYQATDHLHFSDEEFFARKGDILPACPICGEAIEFRLTRKIVHISEDPDFQ